MQTSEQSVLRASQLETNFTRSTRFPYLKTLDGWRAIAVLAVIFHHDELHTFGPLSTSWLYRFGYAGVEVFFAISGVLICSRLLHEERSTGAISIKMFYIRRFFRILPPAFVYLLVLFILSRAGLIYVPTREIVADLAFVRNYASHWVGDGRFAGHFWSLSLEEHFYFILPVLLVFTRKKNRLLALGTLSVIVTLIRLIELQYRSWGQITFHTDARLDALLVPAMLAVMAFKNPEDWRRRLKYWPVLILPVLIVIPSEHFLAITAQIWLTPLIVLGSVLSPDNLVGRILEFRLIKAIGKISYSLYLWQQLFFTQHFYGAMLVKSFALRCILLVALATASYWLVEKPMIRLGHRRLKPKFDSPVI